jgi:hypothetical protein
MEKTAAVNMIDPVRRLRFETAAAPAIGVTPAVCNNWWN